MATKGSGRSSVDALLCAVELVADGDVGYSKHAQRLTSEVVSAVISVARNSFHVEVRLGHCLLDDYCFHLHQISVQHGPSDQGKVAVADEKALFQFYLLTYISRYRLWDGEDVAYVKEVLSTVEVDHGKCLP